MFLIVSCVDYLGMMVRLKLLLIMLMMVCFFLVNCVICVVRFVLMKSLIVKL